MNKQDKISLVESLSPKLKNSTSIIFVDFSGLSVSMQQKLKKQLKEVEAEMTVVKNSLIKRAAEMAKIDEKAVTEEVLSGQTALIFTEGDPISPVQVLGKFAKDNMVPQFKVGIVEGSFQDKDALLKISSLPTKGVLYSQVIGSLMSPMYGLIGTLNGNMQKLIYILKQKAGDN